MKNLTLIAALFAAMTAAKGATTLESREPANIEKRGCLYKTCGACWAATPPIGSAPGSQGSAAGQ
ncbi:unnamed protein product [Parascedosporium putredinis]|uniref:Uncharacterized protein n=1 Tax=Parascedosporium putredinis TaxID=1442378 RepID=A0A9P1H566_9PEZI|nr:unnamed protein product [Parascedosporium putredinis]CAI7998940.1 unnamed protein product [Parascedosporium putredinis]